MKHMPRFQKYKPDLDPDIKNLKDVMSMNTQWKRNGGEK